MCFSKIPIGWVVRYIERRGVSGLENENPRRAGTGEEKSRKVQSSGKSSSLLELASLYQMSQAQPGV